MRSYAEKQTARIWYGIIVLRLKLNPNNIHSIHAWFPTNRRPVASSKFHYHIIAHLNTIDGNNHDANSIFCALQRILAIMESLASRPFVRSTAQPSSR